MFAILWALAFSAPWIVAADRGVLNLQDAMPTGFASCACKKEVLENKSPKTKEVILVTKKWSLDQCISTCPGYCKQDSAPFMRCLEVRTATGTTGDKKSEHFDMIANMVPDRMWGDDQPLDMMVRRESYLPENAYSACSCNMSNTDHPFLYGHEGFMSGLQVWGRVGCDRSCTQACLTLGSDSTGCIQSEMTYATGQVGEVGYQRVPLVVDNGKKPPQKGIQAHKVQQQQQVTESDIKLDIPFDLIKPDAS